MKRLQIVFLTTGVALFLALASCGGSNDEPEPPPPVDTVVVEPLPDTVYVPSWSNIGFLRSEIGGPYECANVIFKRRSDDVPYDEEAMTNIIGTWKLLLYSCSNYTAPFRYKDGSCWSVIYRFDADSTVTVISDTTAIQAGTFKYSYKHRPNWPNNYPDTLRIGEEEFDCWVVDLMLTFTPVWRASEDVMLQDDGGGLFIKLKE